MATSLETLFNHLVLPCQLPGEQDGNLKYIEANILKRLSDTCEVFTQHPDQNVSRIWEPVARGIVNARALNQAGLEKGAMMEVLSNLKVDDYVILYVVKQNAALIIRRDVKQPEYDKVIFEAYEASPISESVLASEGAMEWGFPGRAASVPFATFCDHSFLTHLCKRLEQASVEDLDIFRAHRTKAQMTVAEDRDSADPAFVTQWLMAIVEATGSAEATPKIYKHVRDDVNFHESLLPWRRLPFWLVLRVALHRQLVLMHGDHEGRLHYKLLIATMLSQFLTECSVGAPIEVCVELRKKLAGRMAKLVYDTSRTPTQSGTIQASFKIVESQIKTSLFDAKNRITGEFDVFKSNTLRAIPPLPVAFEYYPADTFELGLPYSSSYLKEVSKQRRKLLKPRYTREGVPVLPPSSMGAQVFNFAKPLYGLCRIEQQIVNLRGDAVHSARSAADRCLYLAKLFTRYKSEKGKKYDGDSIQTSLFLLNAFDLWMQADMAAVKICPLLANYHPIFEHTTLDVLQVQLVSDLERLANIQSHLRQRKQACKHGEMTIFADVNSEELFASKYVNESPAMLVFKRRIEAASLASREAAEAEWASTTAKYDEWTEIIESSDCNMINHPDGSIKSHSHCQVHKYRKFRKNLVYKIHEDLLPENDSAKNAVIFELAMPSWFQSYRELTLDLVRLGKSSNVKQMTPVMTLLTSHLASYNRVRSGTSRHVTLISNVKTFKQTHYDKITHRVSLSQISLRSAAEYQYYDKESRTSLPDHVRQLSFEHHCGIETPIALEGAIDKRFMPFNRSSNDIIAAQPHCPTNMPLHEYSALQRLFSEETFWWREILRECGSSNLDFSSEDTTRAITQLCVRAGSNSSPMTAIRDRDRCLLERQLSEKLVLQLNERLDEITTNWREVYYMATFIDLCLRFVQVTQSHRQDVMNLLKKARATTMDWIVALNCELRNTKDVAAIESALKYGLWAALLCRQTYEFWLINPGNVLSPQDLSTYIQTSIALREYLTVEPGKLHGLQMQYFVRDVKNTKAIANLVQGTILADDSVVGASLNSYWGDSENIAQRSYSTWEVLGDGWLSSTLWEGTGEAQQIQSIEFNFLQGHLLVDNQVLERLPYEMLGSEDVQELFGSSQYIQVYPSSLEGMLHRTQSPINGHTIHFGMRGSKVIIQATGPQGLLEFIPRPSFSDKDGADLPSSLLTNCVHWLNIDKQVLEIRRKPCVWKTRGNDWKLDLKARKAQKNRLTLLSPHSWLHRTIAKIFQYFEQGQYLTIFYHVDSGLQVELKQLDLSFFVNKKGLLQCRQHPLEIDPNQDAGTFYGLQSKIVLRSVTAPDVRSVFVRLGTPNYAKKGPHVLVYNDFDINRYGRLELDVDLRRVHCPPDPQLLFTKALLHASTSMPLSDPLTGRTGLEEACHILSSGYCQPWNPLNESVISILKNIESLCPVHSYYPADKRHLQCVRWRSTLPTHIQHEDFEFLVQVIMRKHHELLAFANSLPAPTLIKPLSNQHLQRRGALRQNTYQRHSSSFPVSTAPSVYTYKSRDQTMGQLGIRELHQLTQRIVHGPFLLNAETDYHKILESWGRFNGFRRETTIKYASLYDDIEGSITDKWGDLFTFCQGAGRWDLVYRLGLLLLRASGNQSEAAMIECFAAVGCLPELRTLPSPDHELFVKYSREEVPKSEVLVRAMEPHSPPYQSLSAAGDGGNLSNVSSDEDDDVRATEHLEKCQSEARRFASHLKSQWPCAFPSVEHFENELLNATLLQEVVLSEWTRLYANHQLSNFVTGMQNVLSGYINHDRQTTLHDIVPLWKPSYSVNSSTRDEGRNLCLADLLQKSSFTSTPVVDSTSQELHEISDGDPKTACEIPRQHPARYGELLSILDAFTASGNQLRQDYAKDLKLSLDALYRFDTTITTASAKSNTVTLQQLLQRSRLELALKFVAIIATLFSNDPVLSWLDDGDLAPVVTPVSLLEELQSIRCNNFGPNIKESLVDYGVAVTKLQRDLRLLQAHLAGDMAKYAQEYQNVGHELWEPLDYCDWLLLEIDSNILIRKGQIDVAHATITPASSKNSLLQMNMGQGKTSCIMPMAAVVLADRDKLCRLIVPKALLQQTAQTM